jgi:hypothetical protein
MVEWSSRPYSVCTPARHKWHSQMLIDGLPQAVDVSTNLHNKVTKSRGYTALARFSC